MAARAEQRVEELVIRGRTEGLTQAEADLRSLAQAHGLATSAGEKASKALEHVGRSMRDPIAAIEQTNKRLVGSAQAFNRFEAELRKVNRAALDSRANLSELARTQEDLAREFGRSAGFKISTNADMSGLHKIIAGQKELSAETRIAVREWFENTAAMEAANLRATKLRAGFEDLKAAQDRLSAGIAEANELRASGAFTDDDVTRRTRQLNDEFTEQSKRLGVANDNLKLTQGQMQGLGYQINDVGTMLAMGASPFQIIASQAGQVVQVLQEGGGIKSSLAAIGLATINAGKTVVGALGPIGLGFAAITTAAGIFALATRKKIPDATETLKKHDEVLSAISDRYEGLADRVKQLGDASASSLGVQAGAVGRDLQTIIGEQRKALERAFVGGGKYTGTSLYGTDDTSAIPSLPQFGPIGKQLDAFRAKLRDGGGDVIALRKELAETYAAAGKDDPIRKAIEAFFQFSSAMADSQKAIDANREAIRALNPEIQRMSQNALAFRDAMGVLDGLGPSAETTADKIKNAFDEATATARTYGQVVGAANAANAATAEAARPSVEALADAQNRLANSKLSPDQRTLAEIRQRADVEIAALEKTVGLEAVIENRRKQRDAELEAASIEIQRREKARRDGYELDLKAINDRTAAQKANTAAERAYIDALAAGEGETEAARRREEARTLSMTQSRGQLAESQRQQGEATARQIEQAQLEYDLVGKSAGEVARLQAEFQLLAQAKDAARSAGFDADTVTLTDKMREQAAELGRLTEATQRLNFERDLLFDRQQAFRSPEDQRIADQLRSIGVEFDSAQGKVYAGQLRVNERLHEANDALYEMRDAGREAFVDLANSIGSSKNALDGLLRVAGDLFGKFASSGWGKLFDGLTGKTSSGSSGGLLSFLSSLPSLTGGGTRAGSSSGSSLAGAPALSFVPVPTPAMRQASAKLAEGVTQSVSTNLLSSLLRSGQNKSHIAGLNSQFASALTNMMEAAPSAVRSALTINSGFRSVARQAELFDAALKKYGSVEAARKWVAPPGNSQHNKGMAADLGYGNVSARQWVHANAGKYGLAFPLSNENWHIELAGARGGRGAASVISDQRVVAKGVEQGLKEVVRTQTPESYSGGKFDAGTPSNPSAGRQLSGGQQAFLGLGGLIGAFSNGYQSASPIGGALNGAMGGFEIGSSLSFLGAAGGPIGAGIGAVAGILGGLLGKRKQKKQEEAEARRQWEGMQPQYEAYRRYLSGEESGNIRTDFQNIQSQFNQFNAASNKAKNGDLVETARSFYAYVQKQLSDFREASEGMAADLMAGAGMDGPFSKGKAAIKQLQKQLLGYLDDVEIAYFKADNGLQGGAPFAAAEIEWKEQRDRAVAIARKGAQDQALSVLNPAKELSAVESNLRSLEGAAQQLQTTLPKLGLGVEETAKRVADDFAAGKAVMRGDFEKSMGDRLLDLQGKGYLTDAREMIAEFAGLQKDAALLGADTSGFAETFRLSAQDIVNGAELTGDAFKELVQRFPELAAVVKEFSADTVTASASEIASAVKGYEERLFAAQNAGNDLALLERRLAQERVEAAKFGADALKAFDRTAAAERAAAALAAARTGLDRAYEVETGRLNDLISARQDEISELESATGSLKTFADGIAQFRKSILVDDSLSTLDPAARLAEARRQFLDLSAKAQAGDEEARSQLTGAGQEYLTEARDFYASSQGYYDAFDEVRRTLDQSEGWARSQLSSSESQLAALKSQIKVAEDTLETNRKQYEALIGLNEGVKSLAEAMKAFAAAASAARDAGITVPGTAGTGGGGGSGKVWGDGSAASYLAKNADVAAAIRNGETFGLPAGLSPEAYASAHYGLHGQSEGRGFSAGGYTGGSSTTEVRGPVHGKEFVFDAGATRAIGPSNLEAIRQTRRLPALVADPYPRGELPSRASGESSMAAEIRSLKTTVEKLGDQLAMVLHGEGEETRAVLRKGNRTAKQTRDALELDAA